MTIEPGQQLLHYRLIEKIGEGGMGVVWKAIDTTLDREVAIKILPATFTGDPGRLTRFEREAKLLASLNHPHLATVFGIHEADGTRFLAMELVPGQDLEQRLRRGKLPIDEAVGLALQIAQGLEAAHERGVVHRDLKPANVRITPSGAVKILDFGLAKAMTSEALPDADPSLLQTMTAVGTTEGALLGTTAYMSPEQARGQTVDTRSDMWSFGCVLWECLTGERLFGGNTASDSIGAILHQEPNWKKLPAETPSAVRRLLRRCLTKDHRRRLHHIVDAKIELEDVGVSADASTSDHLATDAARTLRRYRTAVIVSSIALVAALGWLLTNANGPLHRSDHPVAREHPLARATFTRLTNFPGNEFAAAISRDGRFVAFVTDRDGEYGILVSQIGSHEFRSLSSQGVSYTLTDVDAPIRTVGFSWDGADVLLHAGLVRLQRIPLLGGLARSFLGEEVVNVDWSPDGTRLVYHHFTAGDPVFVSESDGTNETLILPSPEGNHQHYPIWSPDGEWIYLVRGRMNTGDTHLWRVRPDGSDLQRLTDDKRHVAYPAPIDARTVLFCAREPDGAGPWLWALDVESGESRRVSFGLEHYTSVSVSADGKRIVATIEDPEASLWRVPVLNRLAKESDVTPVPIPSVRALAPRFAGEDLFYLSSRGTGDGLWRYRDGESVEIWRGAETPLLEPPALSPGGDEIALVLRKEAGHRLHILSADGAELRALTAEVNIRGTASWSPDGQWLVAGGKMDGEAGLFKIPSKGGPAVRIASGEALSPLWSPAGDLIVYTGPQVSAVSPLLAVTPDGDPIELPAIALLREHRGERFRFLPDGKALIYMNGTITPLDFWLLDLVTMERRRLTQLEGAASMLTFDVTPDGEAIVFDRLRRNSDLVLIEPRVGD